MEMSMSYGRACELLRLVWKNRLDTVCPACGNSMVTDFHKNGCEIALITGEKTQAEAIAEVE